MDSSILWAGFKSELCETFKLTLAWPLLRPQACQRAPYIGCLLYIVIVSVIVIVVVIIWLTLYWLLTGPGWEIDPVLWVLKIGSHRFGKAFAF